MVRIFMSIVAEQEDSEEKLLSMIPYLNVDDLWDDIWKVLVKLKHGKYAYKQCSECDYNGLTVVDGVSVKCSACKGQHYYPHPDFQ